MRRFIFSEVSCFQPATLLKKEPFHRIISKFFLDFEWLLSSVGIQQTPLTPLTPLLFSSEAAIRNYCKKFIFNLKRLSASNCHLLKMDSIRGFSVILPKFYTIHYDLLEFSEHLFYRTPVDGCFYTFCQHLLFRTILYLKKSEKSMTP